jgi:hypothetical protein
LGFANDKIYKPRPNDIDEKGTTNRRNIIRIIIRDENNFFLEKKQELFKTKDVYQMKN